VGEAESTDLTVERDILGARKVAECPGEVGLNGATVVAGEPENLGANNIVVGGIGERIAGDCVVVGTGLEVVDWCSVAETDRCLVPVLEFGSL
jgi:hypothetical protein